MQMMKTRMTLLLVLIALLTLVTATHAQNRRQNRSVNVNTSDRSPVTNCGDIDVTYDRRPAITEENETSLPASQVGTLKASLNNSGVYITGWDRNEYSIKSCKAVPADDPSASTTLREISTIANPNGEITVSGPNDREWTLNLILMVPRLSKMSIETRNGPMSLRDLAGVIHVLATNGPIALNNVGGVVDATTTNGPISVKGASGDHRVTATNGPVHVELSGSRWDGPGIEVSTKNGPLALSVPDGYSSAIAVQTSSRSPVECKATVCAGAIRTLSSPGIIRIGNGEAVVRLSTGNGPLSIQSAKN